MRTRNKGFTVIPIMNPDGTLSPIMNLEMKSAHYGKFPELNQGAKLWPNFIYFLRDWTLISVLRFSCWVWLPVRVFFVGVVPLPFSASVPTSYVVPRLASTVPQPTNKQSWPSCTNEACHEKPCLQGLQPGNSNWPAQLQRLASVLEYGL